MCKLLDKEEFRRPQISQIHLIELKMGYSLHLEYDLNPQKKSEWLIKRNNFLKILYQPTLWNKIYLIWMIFFQLNLWIGCAVRAKIQDKYHLVKLGLESLTGMMIIWRDLTAQIIVVFKDPHRKLQHLM